MKKWAVRINMRQTFIYMRRHTKKRKQNIKIKRTPAYKINISAIEFNIDATTNRFSISSTTINKHLKEISYTM